MAELLLGEGYRVVGTVRRDRPLSGALEQLRAEIELVELDLQDEQALRTALEHYRPDEIYNFAGRASSAHLFDQPVLTAEYNAINVLKLLEAVRIVNPAVRLCQASSSEMFGRAQDSPQNELTPFHPRNPYGVAKLCGHWFVVNYRETRGIFACSSILYNHESPRRGMEFVTRKITRAVAMIKAGRQSTLPLGDLEARRDWGYAGDYVRGMWQMLRAPAADDYVLASGESHSIREFCDAAFAHVGLDYRDYVVADPASRRAPESVELVGNAAKACRLLGWQPSVCFEDLVRMMVEADLQALRDRGEGA